MIIANRYRLLEYIGSGGMSIVHKAEDRLTRDIIALKQMRIDTRSLQHIDSEWGTNSQVMTLAQEFRALAGLRHPYIVPVLDYGLDNEHRPFLTMELVEDAAPLTEAAVSQTEEGKIKLLIQLLNALMYLHRRGIIHRDIKPANVLVDRDNVTRMLDFGLAINNSLSLVADSNSFTGTVAYMAPELFSNPVATIQSDIFAIGVMAYEMFAGQYPFKADNSAQLMFSILQDQPDVSMLDTYLANVIELMLVKNPEYRYQSARKVIKDLCAATGFPEPLESQSIRESYLQTSKFVGREQELATLSHALDQILVNRPDQTNGNGMLQAQSVGSAWLVNGEPGIGKSRLLDEVRIRAVMRGAQVYRGFSMANGGQDYQVLREPMKRLVLAVDLTIEEASILKEIIPEIETIRGELIPDPTPLESRDHRERLVNTIINAIKKHDQPMVLLLEDLQWAIESREPISILLNHVAELPLLIIGSYRQDEAPNLADQLPNMNNITLDRLGEKEMAELCDAILGKNAQQTRLLDLIKRETEGNALFIIEVIRSLADLSGRLVDIGDSAIPESVFAGGIVQVIKERLERVPEWAKPMLRLAAAAGRELDPAVLENFYHTYPNLVRSYQYRLDEWLTICSDIAVLEVPNGTWRFTHDKLRELILEGQTAEEQAALHQLVAETIEQLYPGDKSRAEILLEHWHRADNIEKELYYLKVVVERHIDTSSELEIARNLLQRTLDQLAEDDPRRNMLLVYLSQTYLRIDYARGEALGLVALDQALKYKDDRAIAQVLYVLGTHVREQMRYEEAQNYNQQSLAMFQKLDDLRGSAHNMTSLGIIAHDLSNYEEARYYYEQSLSIFSELGDDGRIAFLEVLIGTLARDQGKYDESLKRIETGLQIARRIGQSSIISHALNNLGVSAYGQGDFEKSKTYLAESLTVYRNMGNQWGIANGCINLGFTYFALEENEAARTSLMEGIQKAALISAINLALEGIVGLGCLAEREGNYELAAGLVGMAEPQANIDVNARLQPLLARLRAKMDPAKLQVARLKGKEWELPIVVENLS
jgi:serine/threonine protein kinase/tetratricopeptide (TPR) repeat protein